MKSLKKILLLLLFLLSFVTILANNSGGPARSKPIPAFTITTD